ncbi:tetratricopeptide repeat protein [Parabacteroides sp. AF18-52]|mgnify:FL=1|nr:tetratricopeptide repeat protein [Parabacteroides sp. AF18-52]
MRYLSYIVFCLLSFVMCTEQPKELLPELSRAELLMQRCPNSALAVLDSMEVPSPSDKFQYATWCLLITQARDKNYIKHISDSLINIALDYFEKQNDPVRKATALYYEGRVNHDLNNAEEAADYYLRARDAAKNTTDYRLLCLINIHLGTLYAYRGLADLALKAYENAYDYSIQLKDSTLISNSYSCLGRVSTLNNDWTKGLDYYKKAIGIAEQAGSLKALTLAYGEIVTVYRSLSMLDSCMYYLDKSKKIEEKHNISALPQTYLGIGETYYCMGQSDSAYFYLEKALNTTNPYTKQDATQTLYYLCRDLGKYEDAIQYNEQYWIYKDSVDNINRSSEIAEIQVKYKQEKLLNINNNLENKLLWGTIILLVIISILIYFYQHKLLKKERTIQENRKQLEMSINHLHENENIIYENETLIKALSSQIEDHVGSQEHINDQMKEFERIRQNNASLQSQNEILQRNIEKYVSRLKEKGEELKTYERLVTENTYLSERQRYLCSQLIKHINILNCLKSNPEYIDEFRCSEIFNSMNIVYPNLIDRLRRDFSLTNDDLLICCLIKLQLNNSIMAELLAISPSSVTKRKQRLKERINQHLETPLEGERSIDAYLWKY